MIYFILHILASALAIFLGAKFLSGVHLKGYVHAIFAALIVAIASTFLGSFLPGMMGDSSIIINILVSAGLLKVADMVLDGFRIDGWLSAILMAVIVALLNFFIPFA